MTPKTLGFIVESGTDVRIVDGLAERAELSVLGQMISCGRVISRETEHSMQVTIGPASRLLLAAQTFWELAGKRRNLSAVLVQGCGLSTFAATCASRLTGTQTFMLVCSPVELYYRGRKHNPHPGMPNRAHELWTLKMLAALNARIGRHYVVRHVFDRLMQQLESE